MQGNSMRDVMLSKPRRRLSFEDPELLVHLSQSFSSLEDKEDEDKNGINDTGDKRQGTACFLAAALETMQFYESEISALLETAG